MFVPRLCSTVTLLLLFSASIFLNNPYGYALFSLMALFLTYFVTKEFCGMLRSAGMETYSGGLCIVNTLLAAGMLSLCFSDNVFFIIVFSLPIALILLLLSVKNSEEKLKKVFHTAAIFQILVPPIILLLAIYMLGYKNGGLTNICFLFFILATKIGDIGAYVTGTLSNRLLPGGNHKMIPSISPGKSYEGAAGGLFFTILLCFVFYWWNGFIVSPLAAVITGTLFFFGGMAGDLAESAIKRACKIKDSGHTIPGIGGIYDLVDSPMMTAPIFWLLVLLQNNGTLAFFKF